ncbi:MAG: outer membrane protein assembly factor BamD [Deltaproteobacteria bacterium]|nr:outer membrane protein assembly factor BamD [Deltaproteobacteria bacterium]MBN2687597.1 outer membrane protein assembly factor BamD [Deltaproteobacteria bacterium]
MNILQRIGVCALCCMALSVASVSVVYGEGPEEVKKQYDFAEYLFNEGDYFRAISEYKRFIFIYPGNRLIEKSRFRICESYYRAGRLQEAIDSLTGFIADYPASPFREDAFYLKGLSEKELKRHDEALSSLAISSASFSKDLRDRSFFQIALIYVDREDWESARASFSKISKDSTLYPSASSFSSGLDSIDRLPRKSPGIAGTLAAVLPGAGHVYTERPRDALVAFLLNGAFIWAAVELFEDENYAAGGLVTFFELGWYTGNIYSAVGSAHKYNRRIKMQFIHNLKERTSLSYRYDRDDSRHYVALNVSF